MQEPAREICTEEAIDLKMVKAQYGDHEAIFYEMVSKFDQIAIQPNLTKLALGIEI
jgi:hypothetical protein